MYTPKTFEIKDKNEIFNFVACNGFGQLISSVNNRFFSTHIPFLLSDDKAKLIGHLSAKNPQVDALEGQEVLVTFQGCHDYISPSWYAGPGVPTWNYQAVHIYGCCQVVREPQVIKHIVEILTQKYESEFKSPWQPNYDVNMLRAIVGIEITISEVQCTYKLSQNRSAQDRSQVIEALKAKGSIALAEAMQRCDGQ